MTRMTWIKPSFLWMMFRSGWAEKENQEHVLAIGYLEYKRPGEPMSMYNNDWSDSTFSKLKKFIESNDNMQQQD